MGFQVLAPRKEKKRKERIWCEHYWRGLGPKRVLRCVNMTTSVAPVLSGLKVLLVY
jgi:hypothetical protein